MSVDFSARGEPADGAWVIVLSGEVDLYTAPQFRHELLDAIGRGASKVVVDLSATAFIDSTALGVLVDGARRLRPAGGRLAVVCSDRNIVKIFHITALDRLFPIYSTREEALASFGDDRADAGAGAGG